MCRRANAARMFPGAVPRWVLSFVLGLSLSGQAVAYGPDQPEVVAPDSEPTGKPPAAQPGDSRPVPPGAEHNMRRAYNVGIVLLGCILICGVGLIAMVLLWGHRARRIARQPLPNVSPRDDLWYLKGKSQPLSEAPTDPDDTPPSGDRP